MEILAILSARSMWFLELNEIDPSGKVVFPTVFDFLTNAYSFCNTPDVSGEIDWNTGLKFQDGKFHAPAGNEVGVNLTIFKNGLIAETRSSTADSDKFLSDLVSRVADQFDLNWRDDIVRRRTYSSEMLVRYPFSLDIIHPAMKQLASLIREEVSAVWGDVEFETIGVQLGPDPVVNPSWKVLPFRLERRADTGFNENRYYSFAPLDTRGHTQVLQRFGSILAPDL